LIRKYESTRQEKLSELGFVCYNRYSDGVIRSPYFKDAYYNIRTAADKLLVARYQMRSPDLTYKYEERLRNELLELGCLCFSLYIDGKITDAHVSSVCENIKQLNLTIASLRDHGGTQGYDGNVLYKKGSIVSESDDSGLIVDNVSQDAVKVRGGGELRLEPALFGHISAYRSSHRGRVRSSRRGSSAERLKVTLPYGMEPIPDEYIRCRCGYRNRSNAVFCAKCGKAL